MVCVFCMHDVMREKFITRRIHDGGFVLVVENFKISECDTCPSDDSLFRPSLTRLQLARRKKSLRLSCRLRKFVASEKNASCHR
jgi:hypothetical protein